MCSSLAREAETVSDACSCPPSLVACLTLRWNLLFAAEWLPVIRSGPFLGLLKARDQENKNMKWQLNLKVAAHKGTCDFPLEGGQRHMGIAQQRDHPQSGGYAAPNDIDQVRQGHTSRQATMCGAWRRLSAVQGLRPCMRRRLGM